MYGDGHYPIISPAYRRAWENPGMSALIIRRGGENNLQIRTQEIVLGGAWLSHHGWVAAVLGDKPMHGKSHFTCIQSRVFSLPQTWTCVSQSPFSVSGINTAPCSEQVGHHKLLSAFLSGHILPLNYYWPVVHIIIGGRGEGFTAINFAAVQWTLN